MCAFGGLNHILLQQPWFPNLRETISRFKSSWRCKWSKGISRHLSRGWRRCESRAAQGYWCKSVCLCVRVLALNVCVCVCVRVLVFNLCESSVLWLCLTLVLSLCSIRNASGLTAADLAYAQGFQECAEILSNAQNFQQNMAQSPNGVFLNGMIHNGSHTHPTFQGRSFLNGVTNRKRSFDDTEANPVKKARPNGMYAHINVSTYEFYHFTGCRNKSLWMKRCSPSSSRSHATLSCFIFLIWAFFEAGFM